MRTYIYSLMLLFMLLTLQGCSQQERLEPQPIEIIEEYPSTEEERDKIQIEEVEEVNPIQEIIDNMTLKEKIGQLFIVSVDEVEWQEGIQGNEAILKEYPVGGVIFFEHNIKSISQVTSQIQSLQSNTKLPLFVSVDEEGGMVSRIAKNSDMGATKFPNMWKIGKTDNEKNAYQVGKIIGTEIKSLGFNMNFAPVADVNTNPNNPIIGERAFGDDYELVARMVAEEVKGLQDQNVSAVIKHFPGHGDTHADTHKGSVYVSHTLERLREIELIPFQSGINAGTDGVMVAHIQLPNVTNDDLPATLSYEIITKLLREELGYDGLVITDALNMGAVADHYTTAEAVMKGFQAGCDILLMPVKLNEAFEVVLEAVDKGEITEEQIEVSLRRILAVKLQRGLFEQKDKLDPSLILGNDEHKAFVDGIGK